MCIRHSRLSYFIVAITSLACVSIEGCGKGPDNQRYVSETKNRLRFACLSYDHLASEVLPPSTVNPEFTDTRSLVAWMKLNGNVDQMQHFLSPDKTTILDAWDQEVLLITGRDGLAGFFSLGPNGKLDGHPGDDIVVSLDESLQSGG